MAGVQGAALAVAVSNAGALGSLPCAMLTPEAMAQLLKDAMRRRAGQALLAGAARATGAGSTQLSMKEIQAEVNAVRRTRKSRAGA